MAIKRFMIFEYIPFVHNSGMDAFICSVNTLEEAIKLYPNDNVFDTITEKMIYPLEKEEEND